MLNSSLETFRNDNLIAVDSGPCMGEIIQESVEKVVSDITTNNHSEISNVLSKCEVLATNFDHSSELTEKLIIKQLESQKDLNDNEENVSIKLSKPVRKKWHSWYTNLAAIKKFHEQISTVLHSDIKYKDLRLSLLTSEEIVQLEEILVVFDNLSATSQQLVWTMEGELQNSYEFCGLVLPILTFLKKTFRHEANDSALQKNLKEKLLNSFTETVYNAKVENNITLLTSTFLHPKYKGLLMFKKATREQHYTDICQNLKSLMSVFIKESKNSLKNSTTISDMKTASKKKKFDFNAQASEDEEDDEKTDDFEIQFDLEVNSYKNLEKIDSEDASEFWHANQSTFPRIAKIARLFLPLTATVHTSQSLFSTAGYSSFNLQKKVLPSHMEMVTFIKFNLNTIR